MIQVSYVCVVCVRQRKKHVYTIERQAKSDSGNRERREKCRDADRFRASELETNFE